MRYLIMLLFCVTYAHAAESVFTDAETGFSLHIPYDAAQKIGEESPNKMMSVIGYKDTKSILTIIIMRAGGMQLKDMVNSHKQSIPHGDVQDITPVYGPIPAKLGEGFTAVTESGTNVYYFTTVNGKIVSIIFSISDRASVPKIISWMHKNNK